MSNFDFVRINEIRELAVAAERGGATDPRSCCVNARIALEAAVRWMFDNDRDLRAPYEENLNAYLKDPTFKHVAPPHVIASCEIIRRSGNRAAHETKPIPAHLSRAAVAELHKTLYWFTRTYFDRDLKCTYDPALIPSGMETDSGRDTARRFAERLAKNLEKARAENESLAGEVERLRAEIAERKAASERAEDTHDYGESETRNRYIDVLLAEAGWKVGTIQVKEEYELAGVKRNADRTGKGYADYVLFGKDGKPLAVVEAKRTSVDAEAGKEQAADYADALEREFGRRPLIYYTNGYETYLWDDAFYPPRLVAGFAKADEMELAVQRRDTREPLAAAEINKEIVERPYQIMAIKAICSHFGERHRRSLVVMATGTGKTRTAIALTELLQKANWVKRVLYLCDRDSLLRQTKRAFTAHLGDTPAADLRDLRAAEKARVCLSTYATMMNLVDEFVEGVRAFSPSHFDLIIIDEAHRSIYQKYQALFAYFDGLLLGLTATPRAEVDRNTYQMFELEDKNPTYAFELEEAVAKGYLVSYEAFKVATGFTRRGVKYAELSEEEKDEYETRFTDPESGVMPEEIESAALNRWLFNRPTVESLIRHLMESGIKVEGGDRIGKTIVFALNSTHAKFIVDCFDSAFPKWAGRLCARVDYSLGKDAQGVIDRFSDPDSFPMIAVSVDMLDTGIDVPEVVNLVFAKPVYSQVKFWQMIGRGTRLCANLFGPGTTENPRADDKTRFLIFDYCGNLEYFAANPAGKITKQAEPLTARLFRVSLILAQKLRKAGGMNVESDAERGYPALAEKRIAFCRAFVSGLNTESFIVRPALRHVEKYLAPDAWTRLTEDDLAELSNHVAPLPTELDLGDEDARRWDLLMLQGQIELLDGNPAFSHTKESAQATATDLLGRLSIPEVKRNAELLEAVATDEFWEGITLDTLEDMREKIRGLVQFIDRNAKRLVYSNFADTVEEAEYVTTPLASGVDLSQYRKRMDALLSENRNHLTINKIRRLVPLTETDLAELDRLLFEGKYGERELFVKLYGDKSRTSFDIEDPPISLLIRSILGLERVEVEGKLAEFMMRSSLNDRQLSFVDKVVDFFVTDGYVPPGALYDPPFDQFHSEGPDALFGADTDRLFAFVEAANATALA